MLNVLLFDDHALVRTGYRGLIDAAHDLHVVGEAASMAQACTYLQSAPVDVVVIDISLRGASGIEAIGRLLARQTHARVLVLSVHDSPGMVTQAMRAGAAGYLSKRSQPEELLDGIRAVARGQRVFSADVAQALAQASLEGEQVLGRLTPREFEVFRMLASGEKTGQIATQMHLSPKTILNHASMVRQKLQTDSDIQLLRLAARHGLVDLQAV